MILQPWVKRYPGTGASGTIVVFPHAGGAASAYRALGTAFAAAGSETLVMQYPQRGDRLTHPAPATIEDLAHDIFSAGDWSRVGPLRLFGHCMGAVVAFEFACVAEKLGVDVSQLWVSASEAPSAVAGRSTLPMSESEILAEMVDLGGTDPRLLDDGDFVELLLMAVRADYRAVNRYACGAEVTIAADIHTLGGSHDRRVSEEVLRGWEFHTSGVFTASMFDGGHFYLDDHIDDVAELVNEL